MSKFKEGDLVQFKDDLSTVYLIYEKSNWAYHLQCLEESVYRSVRHNAGIYNEVNKLKLASDFSIKNYIKDWLKRCLVSNYERHL